MQELVNSLSYPHTVCGILVKVNLGMYYLRSYFTHTIKQWNNLPNLLLRQKLQNSLIIIRFVVSNFCIDGIFPSWMQPALICYLFSRYNHNHNQRVHIASYMYVHEKAGFIGVLK